MFIGHFALGTMVKPLAPTLPIWALVAAPQFMDLLFLPLVAVGVEGYNSGPFGHSEIDSLYTHSLVGAMLIAALAYWIGVSVWKTRAAGSTLASLSFSHWIIDLLVHHNDMPWLPGNLGNFPLLGFGLWDFEYAIFGTEILMAVIGTALYFRWAKTEKSTRFWFAGPIILSALFIALAAGDIATLPMH
ncbi:MAG: hypothetical protein KUG69_13410 [Marinosulfonomonas sp.]|nr:hypothetical protein [Marinosulfonomonas sp.]